MKKSVDYDLSLTDDLTVRDCERAYYEVKKKGFSMDDPSLKLKVSAVKMWKTVSNLRFNEEATLMKIRELREWAELARVRFIIVHRVNYSCFNTMTAFYDWYEEKRKVSSNVKRFWKKTEESFRRYQQEHRSIQERESWCTLQDHLRLVDDAISVVRDQLLPVITNVFIRQRGGKAVQGQLDDIELLAKASIPLLWTRVVRHTYAQFFRDYIKTCGIDFSSDFRYADLSGMSRNFCWMLEQMGVKLHDNKDGDRVLDFFDVDKSDVIETAWNKMMSVVRDEDMWDAKAEEAITMNPKAKERYDAIIRDEEEKQMQDGIGRLSERFNVVKA